MNGVPTHVLQLRHKPSVATKALALIIPGSPGMGHCYVPFARRLLQLGAGSYDVTVVSHAGHSPGSLRSPISKCPLMISEGEESTTVKSDTSVLGDDGRDWYCLEEQVSHKLAFIKEYAEHVDTLYLIGHSIGAWTVLQMLKYLESNRVKKAILLFPTIEQMNKTPRAAKLNPLFTSLRLPFTFVVWCLSWLPQSVRQYVLWHHFYTTPMDHRPAMIQGTMNIDSKAIHNILCMAKQEMEEVIEAPFDIIDANIDKLVFYYGVGDDWNLEDMYGNMRDRYPDKEVYLCENGYSHPFVEESSDGVADFVFSKISL